MDLSSKLIIVEGLPGSGKSTIAQFIAHQLQGNNIKAQWYYEVGLYHPLEFCSVACLDRKDYEELLNKYSDFRSILEAEAEKKYNKYFYKYIELQRKYKGIIPEGLIEQLEGLDVENSNVESYMDLKGKKWEEFSKKIDSSEEITVIESSLFQGPIVTMLLSNKPREEIKKYVSKLLNTVKGYNPTLIYLYEKDVENSIKKILEFRGADFTEYIVTMVCESSYGKSKSLTGIEGAIEFFREYRSIGDELYDELGINKVDIENSEGIWDKYKEDILKFLKVKHLEDGAVPCDILENYVGTYLNGEIQRKIPVVLEKGRLFFYINETYKERLIPIYNNSFHIEASTLDAIFLKNESGKVDRLVIGGRGTAASYGEPGMIFKRI